MQGNIYSKINRTGDRSKVKNFIKENFLKIRIFKCVFFFELKSLINLDIYQWTQNW